MPPVNANPEMLTATPETAQPRTVTIRLATILLWPAAAVVFALLALPWLDFPVYPDEINHRFLVSRADIDGWRRIGFLNPCLASREIDIPLVYLPAAALLTTYRLISDLDLNRYLAIALNSLPLALAWALATSRPTGSPPAKGEAVSRIVLTSGLFLGAFIGIAPLGLVVLRSEHLIMLFLCFAMAALLVRPTSSGRLLSKAAVFSVGYVLFTAAAYSHPKTLYLTPVLLLLAYACFAGNPAALAAAAIVSALAVWSGVKLGGQFMNCPEQPAANAYLHGFNIDPRLLLFEPHAYFDQLLEWNITGQRSWMDFISGLSFPAVAPIEFLPRLHRPAPITNLLVEFAWVGNVTLALLLMLALATVGMRRLVRKERSPEFLPLFGVLLIQIGVFAHLLHNRVQAWYDFSFYNLVLVFTGCIAALTLAKRSLTFFSYVLSAVFLFASVASVRLTTTEYANQFGYDWPDSPNTTFGEYRDARQANLRFIENNCLRQDPGWIAVDDLTYPLLQRHRMVTPITYIALALDGDAAALRRHFHSQNFKALVTRCGNPMLHLVDGTGFMSKPVCCVRLVAPTGRPPTP